MIIKDLFKMKNNIQLNIRDFGPINKANININQINGTVKNLLG